MPEPPAFVLELLEGKLAPHQHSLLVWGGLQLLPCLSALFLCAFHGLLINSDLLSALRSVFSPSGVSSPVLGVWLSLKHSQELMWCSCGNFDS